VSATRPRFKLSFQAKVLIPVVLLLVLLPAVTLIFVQRSSFQHLAREARSQLLTVDAVFQNSLVMRGRQLVARYNNLVTDPRFRAISQLGNGPTMRNHLHDELLDKLDEEAELMIFVHADGTMVSASRSEREVNPDDFQAAAQHAINSARDGEPTSRIIDIGKAIFNATAVPVYINGQRTGVFVAGSRMGRNPLKELASLVVGEAIFIAGGKVVETTLPSREFSTHALPSWSDGGSVASAPIRPILIENVHYLAMASRFPGSKTEKDLGYILLLSYEPAYQQLRETQATLWLLCLVGVTVSAGVIWLLIGRITWPLRDLRTMAEAVGTGDFSKKVEVQSDDELGQLGKAFNQMTRNLRNSHAELRKTVETLRATQAQLIQSEKLSAVGEFVAGVAHELNNPLTSVIGFAELLSEADLHGKHKSYLQYIVKSTERCHKIVQGLLSFARQHPPERVLLDVNKMVEGVLELLAYEMRTSNIKIEHDFQEPLPKMLGDSHQLQQVVLNILNNGRQAIEGHQASGRIRVTTESTAEQIRVVFEDDGPGIKQENLVKIFDPFFTTKPVGKGTGLGLSLCYGIVHEHGGTISAHGEPGKGATFVIELPVHQGAEGADSGPGAMVGSALKGAGKRVLVIDDEEWILELVRQILKLDGFEVDVAKDGQIALQHVVRCKYELLVCDWKMPGLSGPQLYDRIHLVNPEAAARVIFMTGDVVSDTFQSFLKKHSKSCLSKPFSVQEFRQTIGSFIDR
jgi:two-component system NtrC family sensor kinase